MFIDDAWYLLLGKALATGHGYTLINSPSPGIMPEYPPGFPALLALVFRIYPSFPANLWLLKLPSILSLLLSGPLIYYYLVRIHHVEQKVAFGIMLLTLLNPALVFLATSTLMSEVFFMFLQTATLVTVERSLRTAKRRLSWALVVVAAGLASLTFLTRSIGVGLLLAIAVYYLLKKRGGYALAFSLLVCVIVGPWLYYKKQHAPTAAQVFEQKGYIMQTYAASFWQRTAGDEGSGTITYKKLPKRAFGALTEVFGRDIGGLVLPFLYRGSDESGMEVFGMTGDMGMATDAMIISSILAGLCVIGFIVVLRRRLVLSELTLLFTLPIILTWPWPPFRFLLPLTPFIFLYLVSGLNTMRTVISRLLTRGKQRVQDTGHAWFNPPVRIFFAAVILLIAYEHVSYVAGKFGITHQRPVLANSMEEARELMTWMRANVEPGAIVATENPALVHLHTGLKTVSISREGKEELLRRNVLYVAHISTFFSPPVFPAEERVQVLFETRGQLFVYKLR
jgi:hypothetical protein